MKEPVEKKPVSVEAEGETEAQESVTRRRMFGAGLLGVASMLAAACSSTDFAGGSALGGKKKKKDENGGEDSADGPDGGPDGEGGKLDVEDGDDPNGPVQEDTGLDDCAANITTEIDPNGDDIGDLKPVVKFYGRMDSALVAIKFPGSTPINQVIIASPEGKLIAIHTVTGADKGKDGNYRPIVMDNLWLKIKGTDLTDIKIILQTPGGKKAHTEKIAFFTTFNGKSVIDLSQRSVPAGVIGHQSVTQFSAINAKNNTNFKTDDTVKYPFADSANNATADFRNLQTAQMNTVWSKTAKILGTVTDIMGEDITSKISGKGTDFEGIIEYQVFCTYDLSGDKYVRTVLHIG